MNQQLNELRARLCEIDDLQRANAVLTWDQQTYMPPGGAEARGRQSATLARLAHERQIDPALGRLLDALQPYAESLPFDADDAALIRVARRNYERAARVPAAFVAEYAIHTAAAYNVWIRARPANDFAAVQPLLEKTVELNRQLADFFPGYEHIADPLINLYDYGMKASSVRQIFAGLRDELAPLAQALTAQEPADDSCLRQHYPETEQEAFGVELIRQLGYDFERGRQDRTHHPFMISLASGDVRITTRFDAHYLGDGLFSTIHEAGHAFYELGIDHGLDGGPLNVGTSAGVHESQSRLWENLIGRSRSFWSYFYPRLQQHFPNQLGDVTLEAFYRAINKVQRSLIRVDADEVTYNLHVILRFELELQLLEGTLAVADLPEAWNARYTEDLGITPPDDRDGVLQDVHWYDIGIGGVFQGYTLGNILSAQFYEAATRAHPQIEAEIACGEFGTLHGWLKEHIYRHGSKYTAPELIARVTGGGLNSEPYIRYLKTKYGELYAI